MNKTIFTILMFSVTINCILASLKTDLETINDQMHRIEIKIKILEAELSRLQSEEKNKAAGNMESPDDDFFENSDMTEQSTPETEAEFFFEEVSPEVTGKIKQSIASQKAYENKLDDNRASQAANAEYQEYLREQERQRMAMQEFAAGMQSVGMGLQQVHAQSMQYDAQLKQMAKQNRANTAAAMKAYSNAYKSKMESSGYNEWKKSVTAQASGQYYKPTFYGNSSSSDSKYQSSNNAAKTGYSSYNGKNYQSQNYSSPASASGIQKKNWWIMGEFSGTSMGTARSSRFYLVQSSTPPSRKIDRKNNRVTGIAGGPYTHEEAKKKLKWTNNSALKFNVKSDKDAEKVGKNLHNLMMKNPKVRKQYLQEKAKMGF